MAGLSTKLAKALINHALSAGSSETVIPQGLSPITLRAAVYQQLASRGLSKKFRTSISGEKLVMTTSDEDTSFLVNPSHSQPVMSRSADNGDSVASPLELVTPQHSPQLLAAFKVLLEHEVIAAVRILNLTSEEFCAVYPDTAPHFTVKPLPNGVQLL